MTLKVVRYALNQSSILKDLSPQCSSTEVLKRVLYLNRVLVSVAIKLFEFVG
jgi:hypothetical protein